MEVSAAAEANSADSGQAASLTTDLADGDLDSLVNNLIRKSES